MSEIINRKKSDVVPPLPPVTHYRGLPWDDVCFCLFLILLHQPAFHSRAPFRERSLRMQIMLGSLQRLRSGLKARGRERKRRFHIQSKPNVWGRERRECTGENGETEVEEKGATSERRKKMKRGKWGGGASEVEQILRLWRHRGTSLNCSRFFLLLLDALCIHVLRPVVSPRFALLCGAVFSEEGPMQHRNTVLCSCARTPSWWLQCLLALHVPFPSSDTDVHTS